MKFGWRLTWLGIGFLALFGVLLIRLWYVQLAAGAFYATQAEEQAIDVRPTSAPRGMIIDRDGRVLVRSRFELGLLIDRRQIPTDEEDQVVQVISAFLGSAPAEISQRFDEEGSGARFVLTTVDQDTAYRILERSNEMPGVSIEEIPVRQYELGEEGTLMAHIIGYVGLPSPEDVAKDPNLDRSAVVGRAGVERQYDELLRGSQGFHVFQNGNLGLIETRREPAHPGVTLKLTVDSQTQQIVEGALRSGLDLARDITERENEARIEEGKDPHPLPDKGAIVVMDPNDFSILAMASYPAFAPQDFVGGIDEATYDSLLKAEAFNNRVIQGSVPPASTFKAVTYMVAMEEGLYPAGVTTSEQPIQCSKQLNAPFTVGLRQFRNWRWPEDDGSQNLHDAFSRSCNTYFFDIGLQTWEKFKRTDDENVIQSYARTFGFGSATGVDLPFEWEGIVPDRELFDQWARDGDPRLDPSRIVVGQDVWYGGDLVQMAVGQGAMLATPLQMANAYAAMVNGGRLGQPHVVAEIQDLGGTTIQEVAPTIIRRVELQPETVESFLRDLTRVTNDGTASQPFADFGPGLSRIGGKTGTAEITGDRNDHAWFVGVAPTDRPQYVVVVFIEEGGFGGAVAAPVAKPILQYLMGLEPDMAVTAGAETD